MLDCRICGTPSVIQPQQHARDCPLHDPATCRICGPGIDLLSEQELSELRAMVEREARQQGGLSPRKT